MNFESPIWLYLAPIAGIAILLFFKFAENQRRALLARFASARLLPELQRSFSNTKAFAKKALFFFGIMFVLISLSRPQWGYRWEETKTRGIDIVFAIDTSKSMLAEDVKPNRLERAKLSVLDLVNSLKGDRIGIVAFSGQAFLQCPLTLDYDAFRISLEALDTNTIKRGGTNIAAAISEALVAFSDSTNKKIIILISDGEELEASAYAKANDVAKDGVIIYSLGVGGQRGNNIPVRDEQGALSYIKDEFGNVVSSKLNEEVLTKVAKITGGFYEPLGASGMDLIYENGLKKIPQSELSTRMKKLAIERFQIPLLIAIVLIALESVLGTRKFFFKRTQKSTLVLFFALVTTVSATKSKAEETSPRDIFNQGVELLEKSNAISARDKFLEAIKNDEETKIHPKAFYNLADAEYKLAREEFLKASPAKQFENADLKIADTANAITAQAAQILTQAKPMLAEDEKIAKQSEKLDEKQKAEALKKSPLRSPQFQQMVKAEIQKCEALQKQAEQTQKIAEENLIKLNKTKEILHFATNATNSALDLDSNYERAKRMSDTLSGAEKNLAGEISISEKFIDAAKDEKGSMRKSLLTLNKAKEELKKLLRDDNQQNQNNQDNQQNQNQNQDQQNNQEQNQQQNQNQQNQNEQENEQKQNNQNKQEQNKEQKNQQDKNKQDSQKDKEDNSNSKQDKSEKDQREQDKQKQDEQAVPPQKQENAKESEEQKRDEQAAHTQASPSEQVAQENKEKKDNYRRAIGAMSREEARQMLDAIKADEKSLPMSGFGEQRNRYEEKSYKDW